MAGSGSKLSWGEGAPLVDAPTLQARPAPWGAGAIIAQRYRLVSKLGHGAMGEVWLADSATERRRVALKLIDASGDPDRVSRFLREARSAAALQSSHVVAILDHGVDRDIGFLAMEVLEGEGLDARLVRKHHLDPGETATILWEMSRAIDKAHGMRVIHRDLKPSNVFIARERGGEVVKLLDFGIAKVLGGEMQLQTQEGVVVGTPAYMSPEQVLGKQLDHRSDLWAMAMIAFECLTGERAFEGASLGDLFLRIVQAPLPVPSKVVAARAKETGADAIQLPDGFDAWFARAAKRDPDARFDSAGELAHTLCAILAPDRLFEISTDTGMKRPVSPYGSRTGAWATPKERERSAKPAIAIGAVLGASLMGAIAVMVLRTTVHAAGSISSAQTSASIAIEPSPPPATTAAASATGADTAATTTKPTASATPTTRSPAPARSAQTRTNKPHEEDLGF